MSESLKKELETLCLEILKSPQSDYDKLLDWSYALQEKIIIMRHLTQEKPSVPSQYIQAEPAQEQALFVIEEEEKSSVVPEQTLRQEPTEEKPTIEIKIKEEPPVAEPSLQAKLTPEKPIDPPIEPKNEPIKSETSSDFLNKKFATGEMKVGLNDRIAFVKHLFRQSTEDFNRVLSQINSFENLDETLVFLDHMVAPEYGWRDKEEYVKRFKVLVAMRFGVELNDDEV